MKSYLPQSSGTLSDLSKKKGVQKKGAKRVPGISYNCAHGRHTVCFKVLCTCPCGHPTGGGHEK